MTTGGRTWRGLRGAPHATGLAGLVSFAFQLDHLLDKLSFQSNVSVPTITCIENLKNPHAQ